ncbi:hypothetical protein OS493_011819 [Desmophyllum pertusum]|uniref:Uncharacterized protein n=1 Tax=Desmophyllum pertusum TaxID=174260 RepID=A0A9W9YH35_9CNID|nr:hypothetical protein OS493_011819 [Desmophyllum pertusum]
MQQPVEHLKVLTIASLQALERISGKALQRFLSTKQGRRNLKSTSKICFFEKRSHWIALYCILLVK